MIKIDVSEFSFLQLLELKKDLIDISMSLNTEAKKRLKDRSEFTQEEEDKFKKHFK